MSKYTTANANSEPFLRITYADLAAPGDFSLVEVVVFSYLRSLDDSCKSVFPSYETIAKKCRVSRSTAKRAVKKLVSLGVLSVENDGFNVSNIYQVEKQSLAGLDTSETSERGVRMNRGEVQNEPGGGQDDPARGVKMVHYKSTDKSINKSRYENSRNEPEDPSPLITSLRGDPTTSIQGASCETGKTAPPANNLSPSPEGRDLGYSEEQRKILARNKAIVASLISPTSPATPQLTLSPEGRDQNRSIHTDTMRRAYVRTQLDVLRTRGGTPEDLIVRARNLAPDYSDVEQWVRSVYC